MCLDILKDVNKAVMKGDLRREGVKVVMKFSSFPRYGLHALSVEDMSISFDLVWCDLSN